MRIEGAILGGPCPGRKPPISHLARGAEPPTSRGENGRRKGSKEIAGDRLGSGLSMSPSRLSLMALALLVSVAVGAALASGFLALWSCTGTLFSLDLPLSSGPQPVSAPTQAAHTTKTTTST